MDEIDAVTRDITKNGEKTIYDALIAVQERKIAKIKQETNECRNKINIPSQKYESAKEELIKNCSVIFIEEFDFCIYELTIYWDSLYTEYKKKKKEKMDINVTFLTRKELIDEYKIDNFFIDFIISFFSKKNS